MSTPDPDKLWTKLDALGPDEVRKKLAQGVYAKNKVPLIHEWLRRADHQVPAGGSNANTNQSNMLGGRHWTLIQRVAAIGGVVGFIVLVIGGVMRFGQTDFGYQILGKKRPDASQTTEPSQPTQRQTHEAPPETPPKDLFEPGNPFPQPFTSYKLGTRMSVFLAAFQNIDRQKTTSNTLAIPFANGPFGEAYYSFTHDRIDPIAQSVTFVVRITKDNGVDEKAVAEMRQAVLAAFHSFPYQKSPVNDTFYWDNVNGYALELDDTTFKVSLVH